MFVELRAHSAFSFGDGSVAPERLVERAAQLGHRHLGLTDRADLGGIVRFAAACHEHGVAPTVGAELIVEGRPLALLVQSAVGFRNLASLVTRSRVGPLRRWAKKTAHRGRPSLTWDRVAERAEGLFLTTGPASSALMTAIARGEADEADRLLARYRSAFDDRIAIEVQLHHAGRQEEALAGAAIEVSRRTGIRWFATQNPRYIDSETRLGHEILTALRHDTDLETATRRGLLHPNGEWALLSSEDMLRRWRGAEHGVEASAAIAAICPFQLGWVRPPLPDFRVPPGHDNDSFLRHLTFEGARERWGEPGPKEVRQLEHELGIIQRLGYSGFFLVMWEAIRFAKSRGILAQGRGSAANSATAYCLGITAVDPVKYGLLFERFLSEARVNGMTEAPDIDVDFEHDRREEVLDFMYKRYGRSHAAITAVTQMYSACTAVQDSMRALGYPAPLAFALSKRLHRYSCRHGAEVLEAGLAQSQGLDLNDPRGRSILAALRAFHDVPRLRSTHPGGFVISSGPLGDHLPIESTSMGRTIIQFDKDDLDVLGIPKFDFLGLGGLAVVHRAFDAIEARTGKKLSMFELPTDDPATYRMISKGETLGTFQIESRAQIASILHTKPNRLYDIVVQVALIRPGPIQADFVDPYTRRRRGLEPVTYLHPKLEPILERTQGIPIFQEQAMAIAMALADYSAAEADLLRRTMGHQRKKPKLTLALETLRQRLVDNQIEASVAEQIVHDLTSFANYGFPESHAWSFALIAYATAYLKAHHPEEFLVGLLNSQPMGFYSVSTLIHDARRHGVVVVGPCLKNGKSDAIIEIESQGQWQAAHEGNGREGAPARVRLGWREIRGLGNTGLKALTEASARAPFQSIEDIVRRTKLDRSDAIALARSGALDAWEPDRRKAAWEALRGVGDSLPLAPARRTGHHPRPLGRTERIFLDYYATGTSLLGHPVEHLRRTLRAAGAIDSRDLLATKHGEEVLVGGLVIARQRPESANNVIFLLLEDEHGFLNAIVRPELDSRYLEAAKHAPFLLIHGTIQRRDAVIQILAQRMKPIRSKSTLAFRSRDFR